MVNRQIFEVWGGEVNKMNKKNEKTWRVGWVLVLTVTDKIGQTSLASVTVVVSPDTSSNPS